MSNEPIARIALIGFGEAGGILGRDLAARGLDVSTYDILFDAPASREAMLAKARSLKVRAALNLADASRDAQLVISAVTAASALGVAVDASRRMRRRPARGGRASRPAGWPPASHFWTSPPFLPPQNRKWRTTSRNRQRISSKPR